jgi:hypothetical protein
MKLYPEIIQGTPEWLDLRRRCFTASELGPFALEPVKVTLSVDQLKLELDGYGIPRKGLTKRDDLLELLPNLDQYAELSEGARTAIIKKIVANNLKDAWQTEMDAKAEKSFEYNIPVQRGNALEPYAREYYQQRTGFAVTEVGFIEHDTGGFGCSPDGLIYATEFYDHSGNVQVIDRIPAHGIEIKCPMPEAHLAWLDDGVLPSIHELQVHACMAVTGLDRWDFLSFCPGHRSLLIEVYRSGTTDRLESGLKTLVAERKKMEAKGAEEERKYIASLSLEVRNQLKALWKDKFGGAA